jgi:hypothetical protein
MTAKIPSPKVSDLGDETFHLNPFWLSLKALQRDQVLPSHILSLFRRKWKRLSRRFKRLHFHVSVHCHLTWKNIRLTYFPTLTYYMATMAQKILSFKVSRISIIASPAERSLSWVYQQIQFLIPTYKVQTRCWCNFNDEHFNSRQCFILTRL